MNKTYLILGASLNHIVLVHDSKVVVHSDVHVGYSTALGKAGKKTNISDLDKGLQKELTAISYSPKFDLYEWIGEAPKAKVHEDGAKPDKPADEAKAAKKAAASKKAAKPAKKK